MLVDAKCKKCKSFKEKLFLKSERCYSPKCPMLRQKITRGRKKGRSSGRISTSEYGRQLLEKQKVKINYGLSERQLKKYFNEAFAKKGSTPDLLAKRLEMRFDSIIFTLGFAASKSIARQLTTHGHFMLNGKRHDIPSSLVKINDEISIRPQSQKLAIFQNFKEKLQKHDIPKWLSLDIDNLKAKVLSDPDVKELSLPYNFSLIVEFYSR